MASLISSGSASGTGSMTLVAPVTNSNQTATLPDATGNIVVAGANSAITSGTAVASTSGTSIDFTGIPSWVKRVTVMLNGVSTNGTSNIQIQLGYSGGFVITGYASQAQVTTGTRSTTGLIVTFSTVTSSVYYGQYICSLQSSSTNAWVGSGAVNTTVDNMPWSAGGLPSMAGVLDRVRITTVNGTDTFDAGSINILWE